MSPPGTQRNNGARPLNRSSEMRERERISPIQINMGMAANGQALLDPQIDVAITCPTGTEVNSVIPTKATPKRQNATHTPLPRKAKKTINKIAEYPNCSMAISSETFSNAVVTSPAAILVGCYRTCGYFVRLRASSPGCF